MWYSGFLGVDVCDLFLMLHSLYSKNKNNKQIQQYDGWRLFPKHNSNWHTELANRKLMQ